MEQSDFPVWQIDGNGIDGCTDCQQRHDCGRIVMLYAFPVHESVSSPCALLFPQPVDEEEFFDEDEDEDYYDEEAEGYNDYYVEEV